jgi:hypothetical protein
MGCPLTTSKTIPVLGLWQRAAVSQFELCPSRRVPRCEGPPHPLSQNLDALILAAANETARRRRLKLKVVAWLPTTTRIAIRRS